MRFGEIYFSALAALAGPQNRPQATAQQTHEMTVPNELIGCIIGKGGSKIAEIRFEILAVKITCLRPILLKLFLLFFAK